MAAEPYGLLAHGRIREYRRRTYERRDDWPKPKDVDNWGASSFRPDGTARAIRVVPKRAPAGHRLVG
ncbi:hypothetical protein [Streptomyces sp. NPDC060243]|uniref:hypothetical protein n=1 Tax=Streptomyces sp. NPDC060243 TaxID=3347081 RepID=UPI00365208FD